MSQLVFHDDGPFLLVTQSSFDDLSRRLFERDVTEHVTLEHFRPTITISGDSPPFDEVSAFLELTAVHILDGRVRCNYRTCIL